MSSASLLSPRLHTPPLSFKYCRSTSAKSFAYCCPVGCSVQSIFPSGRTVANITFHTVARVDVLEYLVAINKGRILIVDDDFETEFGLLPIIKSTSSPCLYVGFSSSNNVPPSPMLPNGRSLRQDVHAQHTIRLSAYASSARGTDRRGLSLRPNEGMHHTRLPTNTLSMQTRPLRQVAARL